MNLLDWKPAYALGIPSVDAEHRDIGRYGAFQHLRRSDDVAGGSVVAIGIGAVAGVGSFVGHQTISR